MDLNQIEADVVITLFNDDTNSGKVLPFWECDIPKNELYEIAVIQALKFNELCGMGETTFEIHDYRK